MTVFYTILIIVVLLCLAVLLFFQLPMFGKDPSGKSLARVQNSPHYKNGRFINLVPTQIQSEKPGALVTMKELIASSFTHRPHQPVPSQKTDLTRLGMDEEIMVWFGHSSFFIRTRGQNMLFDPIFSGAASPLPFWNKAYPGSNVYTPQDLPQMEYLFLSHDHWDHLDYETLKALRPKVGQVFCGLGMASHLLRWGYRAETITEMDWGDSAVLQSDLKVHATTSRHFSGRKLGNNKTLWLSFVIEAGEKKIFYSGDSGYGPHFAEIGRQWGPFDLAILENGQYDRRWRFVHMFPDEVLAAAKDLEATRLFPVHVGKFTLAMHEWDEPLRRITGLNDNEKEQIRLLTPMIGEKVRLWDEGQRFVRWWEKGK